MGHESAVRPSRPGKDGSARTGGSALDLGADNSTPSAIISSGIDWRLVDPSADAVAGLNLSKGLSPAMRSVLAHWAAKSGVGEADAQAIIDALSGVERMMVSVHEGQVMAAVTRRGTEATLPTVEQGWKAASATGNKLLLGYAPAVDQILQSLATDNSPDASRPLAGIDVWAVGAGALLGPQAAGAGMVRFSITGSIQDRFAMEAAFEFESKPDLGCLPNWVTARDGVRIEGNLVRMSLEGEAAQHKLEQLVLSPLVDSLRVARNLQNHPVASER